MKKIYFLLISLSFLSTAKAQIVTIPDANFKAKLLAASTSNTTAKNLAGNYFKIDANSDGQIQLSEALSVKQLNINYAAILSLEGISSFTNIQILNCQGNLFSSLDVSVLTNLQTLNCGDTQYLSSLNVSGLTNLQTLNCSRSYSLPLLNVSGLTNLQTLDCSNNNLKSLIVSGLENLQNLNCSFNLLPTINIIGLANLQTLNCTGNTLTSLNVTDLTNLQNLQCDQNLLTSLDASSLTNLKTLFCGFNQLATLNVSGLTNLQDLVCENNQLSSLDLTGLINLITLRNQDNLLTSINFNGLSNLEIIVLSFNNISVLNLTGLSSKLKYLDCDGNQLSNLDLSGFNNLLGLNISYNNISNIDVSQLTKLEQLYCASNQLTSLNVSGLTALSYLICDYNPSLSCIQVDNIATAMTNYWKDTTASFSLNCNYTQTFCDTSTVANLSPNGTNIKWYDSLTGGTQLDSTTLLTTKTYYYTQTVSGIEGALIPIAVIVNSLPSKPGIITGEVSPGALVGTTIPATYSIAAVSGASSYVWTVPTGVNIVSGQGSTSIVVNFKDVPAGAGAIGNLMIQSINDSGCFSVAEKRALTISLPAAPDSLVMTDGVTSTPITSFAKYMGTTTILKLTAELVATATSYEWELPTGVIRTDSSGINSTVPYVYVNFSGVTKANTITPVSTYVLRIGVKSKNGVGVSTTDNTTVVNPTTTSTAKLLTLNALLPGAVSSVFGQVSGICAASSYIYTFTADALASSYVITAPEGSVVTSTNNPTNAGNVLVNSDLTFTVTYPIGFSIKSKVVKTIAITSVNGIGNSLTNKVITLSTTMPAVDSIGGGTTYSSCNQTFTATQVVGATTYTWTVPSRASIVSGQGTNTVMVNYGRLTGAQTIKVKTTNSCGVSSAVTSLSLTAGTCPTAKQSNSTKQNNQVVDSVNRIIVYPNPVNSVLFIKSSNNATIDKVIVVDLLGRVILEETPVNNQINVEQFASGTYIIEAFSGNEKFQSKFIKE